MIKKYNEWLVLEEANVNKVERKNLKIGDTVLTQGTFDGVNLDYQKGKIIEMKEYGHLLIEFDESFSKQLHAGNKNIGKAGHCFYIPLDNIVTNNEKEIQKTLKGIGEEKKNKAARLNNEYKEGDVVIGVGHLKRYQNLKLEGEIGIVYYQSGQGGLEPEDRTLPNNKLYWVGFLDKFDNRYLGQDNDGLPANRAGLNVDKIHLRPATAEEKEKFKDKLDPLGKQIESMKKTFEAGTIVVANGNYGGLDMDNQVGIVRSIYPYGGYGKVQYNVQFMEHFHDYLYDVDYEMGDNIGYRLPKIYLREATPEEIEKWKTKIKSIEEDIKEYNYDYKEGEYVITRGDYDMLNLDGQIGIVGKSQGQKPRDTFDIEFITRFSDRLYRIGKKDNCYRLGRRNLSPAKGIDVEDIKKKLENKELVIFQISNAMAMLLNRIDIKVRNPFMTYSYFDVTDKNDVVSYLPVDKLKRLEGGENPFKSRLRQQVKVGKFLRMLNKDLTDKEVETFVNGYKAAFDICISGLSDKLRLVSGEDVRYWYNHKQYVKGGGDLNASCMRGDEKGPEMQMFVENPDVIQLLILTDEKNKLLGRALIWRLVVPEGGTYMDYCYTRFDKDRELFVTYAEQHGWISGDIIERRDGRGSARLPNMICALNTNKRYRMGKDALDHFDTLMLDGHTGNYLHYGNSQWKRVNPIQEKPKEGQPEKKETAFQEGDKIVYKKAGSVNDNKIAKFVSVRDDGKYRIIFDDTGRRFAANPQNVFPAQVKEEE